MFEVLWQTPTGRLIGGRLADAELIAPDLLDAEIASALRRRLLRGDVVRSEAEQAIRVLAQWPIHRVSHAGIVEASMRWWNNVSAYDAMYLATATIHEATVITVDGPLARAPVSDVVIENVRVGG